MLNERGYSSNLQEVYTQDDYILKVIRLGKLDSLPGTRVALMVSGLAMRAEHWVTWFNDTEALPLKMVEQGFDVWLGNNRGNRSGGHRYL